MKNSRAVANKIYFKHTQTESSLNELTENNKNKLSKKSAKFRKMAKGKGKWQNTTLTFTTTKKKLP
jgi:hypothetical protein